MSNPTNNQLKILLVEDEPIVMAVHRKMLTDIGKHMGYTLDTATDGEQALIMSENNYDLIFMDIGLPHMSGIKVSTEIRRREGGNKKHAYIIALTGFPIEEIQSECHAAGIEAILQKPIDAETLQKKIQQALKLGNGISA